MALAMRLRAMLGAAVAGTMVAAVAGWVAIGMVGPARAAVSGGTWGPGVPVPGLAALAPHGDPVFGSIHALSCMSPGNCAAVGYYAITEKTSTGSVTVEGTLVVTKTNGTWGSAQAVSGAASLGAGTYAVLNLVSCGAASDCTAVGNFKGSDGKMHAFLVTEANGSWGTAAAVDDSGLGSSQATVLGALSCPAAGDCTAVGSSQNESTRVRIPVTLDEAGHSWGPPRVVPGLAGLPTAGGSGGLGSVSCAAPGECAAGGLYVSSSGADQPFIASESGGSAASAGTWGGAQAVPGFSALSGSTDGIVTSVSCADAAECAVAGLSGASISFGQVFTVDESGGTWGQAKQLSIPGTTLPVNYFTRRSPARRRRRVTAPSSASPVRPARPPACRSLSPASRAAVPGTRPAPSPASRPATTALRSGCRAIPRVAAPSPGATTTRTAGTQVQTTQRSPALAARSGARSR